MQKLNHIFPKPPLPKMSNLSFSQLLLNLTIIGFAVVGVCRGGKYSRHDFPSNFVFGSGTSAYQVEGATNQDGRTPSVWDIYAHSTGSANGDVACDHYHKYKEDVQLMADIGLEAYKFSISWSRLIPNGRGPVNPKGLQYYNNLINELLRHGIQPHVTLVHIDHPQSLEDEYGGWLSRKIIKDFIAYADVCFREFGDRVKYWNTVNQPNMLSSSGYDLGVMPPKRCSIPFGLVKCTKGNSSTEPYVAAHNMLLAHASAVRLYRKKYQEMQHGFIGLCIYTFWHTPFTDSKEDILATQRAYDFLFGWMLDPLVSGDYPNSMKQNAGSRMPALTKAESELVKGSFDFIGIIHYFSQSVKDNSTVLAFDNRDYNMDKAVVNPGELDMTGVEVIIAPWSLEGVLEYLKRVYGNPPVFVYENGQRLLRNTAVEDTPRVEYMESYIEGVLNAVRNGSDTRGYFTWSFLDTYELARSDETSFGLFYVDLDDPDLKRYPKLSAQWYSDFLKGKTIGQEDAQGPKELPQVSFL